MSIVQSLWWPALNEMERLCVRSYLAQGVDFHLYSYGFCEGVPLGAVIMDASEILPASEVDRFGHIANFADWFRLNLLYQRGGWWVDMDTICLRPFDTLTQDVVLTQEDFLGPTNPDAAWRRPTLEPFTTNAWLKFPAGHPALAWMISEARKLGGRAGYIDTAGLLITRAAKQFAIPLVPSHLFNCLNWWEWHRLLDVPAYHPPADAYAVHLYRFTWRANGRYGAKDIPPGCLYDRWRHQYAPRVLVACSSCWSDTLKGRNDDIRRTWGQTLPPGWDLRFFLGGRNFTPAEKAAFTDDFLLSPNGYGVVPLDFLKRQAASDVDLPSATLRDDEICLSGTPDCYIGLPCKTRDSLKWALGKGYDYILRVFTDTYVHMDRMQQSDWEDHDAVGWTWTCPSCPAHPGSEHPALLGGTGYWLSQRAARTVVDSPVAHWAEDADVGYALHNAGIPVTHNDLYLSDPPPRIELLPNRLTHHLGSIVKAWDPQAMYKIYATDHPAARPKWSPGAACIHCGSMRTARHPLGMRCAKCGRML